MHYIKKIKKEWTDALRYAPQVRRAFRRWFTSKGDRAANYSEKLDYYFKGATSLLSPSEDTLSARINAQLDKITDISSWAKKHYGETSHVVSKGIIIKPFVSEQEKGVIYVSFEKHLIRLLNANDFSTLQDQFIIVFAPSWSPPHSPALFAMPRILNDGLFTTISNAVDHDYMALISTKLTSLHLYASSWVNSEKFQLRPFEDKDIDLLVIANYGTFKRHIALFKALSELSKDIRVTLIGQEEPGRTLDDIKNEAELYGVGHMIEFAGPQPYEKITEYLSRSKTTAIFSKREGSCVVVVESMAANVPVAVLKDAELGSKEFVNDQTGVLLENTNMGKQLQRFIDNAGNYQPRQWLLDNGITYQGSVKYLNNRLKHWHKQHNKPWTKDLFTLERSPLATIAKPEEQKIMQKEQQRVYEEFGLWIGREKNQ
ncbi:glycosyltransferase [Aestuariibacter sp. A3R04]|uniref:glycosyltransferase n=1 Tax=Aestuariibacter sp. A3R04 TaxID=2841571 RepID=UPI001C09ED3E|nr:glycosyltransferase [Aestuariibacter sp. A3R04]MBU3021761.1 glycosyltransferase [Aestuariibacter sp. A3R04]